ncbi:unnamed protein product [Boreogadus saida]
MPPHGQEKTPLNQQGRNLEKKRSVGDPFFQGWSRVQWVPQLTYMYIILKMVMWFGPVIHEGSPGIQSSTRNTLEQTEVN